LLGSIGFEGLNSAVNGKEGWSYLQNGFARYSANGYGNAQIMDGIEATKEIRKLPERKVFIL